MDDRHEKLLSAEQSPELDDKEGIFTAEFQIDDLLDLKALPEMENGEEEEEDNEEDKGYASFPSEKDSLLEITVPEETVADELEWLSRFVHDCHSDQLPAFSAMAELRPPCFPANKSSLPVWRRPEKENFIPVKAKRTKRRRLSRTGGLWFISNSSPVSSTTSSPSPSSSSSSSYASHGLYKKKRKWKLKSFVAGSSSRQCAHCGVQKTPQWRAGPDGPKSLCNACGVRFKSGRLLPEYRPACSPTFVSNIHSNKHRKVLEMRRNKEGRLFFAAAPPVQSF